MTDAGEPTPQDDANEQGQRTPHEQQAAAAYAANSAAATTVPDATEGEVPDIIEPADAEAARGGHAGVEPVEDPRSREELRAELTAAETQRDEFLDDLRRARAEFENFRKRTTRESAGQRDLGRADVATALLEVLDDLDRTLEAAGQSADETLAKGVDLVADKLVRTLRGLGLERLDEVGVPFDPNLHEAVSQQPAEEAVEHPRVAQVFRPGYRMGDRVLRPAMVVVEQ
ncbi:MAG TPA: nucleotide exchange factor GrpE [Egicoccus sp.]|nr:nucleotide exchange factor GrpE [Egicoccus sp.]HSK23245.1 nucleotide exchange factor GrpE [Egicoccus sp.]